MFPVLLAALLSVVASDFMKIGELLAILTPFLAVYIGAGLEARVTKHKKSNVLASVFTGLMWIVFSMATQHLKKGIFYDDPT
jgi:multidrug transporter EmrE-like cation transporter